MGGLKQYCERGIANQVRKKSPIFRNNPEIRQQVGVFHRCVMHPLHWDGTSQQRIKTQRTGNSGDDFMWNLFAQNFHPGTGDEADQVAIEA